VNIGSGNVMKLSWNTPSAENNMVSSFKVHILRYNSAASTSYIPLYEADVGKVNEFYVRASLFDAISQSFFPLYIYVEAVSQY
jgi:hypothetical protein